MRVMRMVRLGHWWATSGGALCYGSCYRSSRNCSTVSPASRTIPPSVKALTGVVPRNRQDARAVRHDDVLALTDDHKPCLPQSTPGVEVIDARDLRQGQTATSVSYTHL